MALRRTSGEPSPTPPVNATASMPPIDAAKENLRLTRPEYIKRADKKLGQLDADVQVLHEMLNAPGQRDYFKTRVTALDQHVAYAKTEYKTLVESDSEAMFRARQAGFNKTLWTLEAAVEQAQEEAGL